MIRELVGVAAGVAAATLTFVLVETLGNQIAPAPQMLDVSTGGSAADLPFETYLFPAIGGFLAPLVGGLIAVRYARVGWPAWFVSGVFIFGTVLRMLLMRHPTWLVVTGIAAPLLAAWIAQRFATRDLKRG